MLMMKRRQGEAILIGDDIEIHLAHIGRTRVKIGIKAPRHLAVVAKEVQLVKEENRAAAECDARPRFSALVAQVRPSSAQEAQKCPPEPSRSNQSFP